MEIGLIGLGKMGYNLALNIKNKGHKIHAFDIDANIRNKIKAEGVGVADSYEKLIGSLSGKKVIWLMIPSGPLVDEVMNQVTPLLTAGDILIDGGNSNFKDTLRRYEFLKKAGIGYLDCGTSGGVNGALNGVCTMIGGEKEVFGYCEQLFKDISIENGYLYAGKPGSGHFLKMVHNGIEYGMMQAIAEGFEVLESSNFEYDYENVARVWNNGSVVRGWLMELTQNAFSKDSKLSGIKGVMNSSGEGKWTLETALDLGVPTPVIALSLMMRYRSQQDDTFSGKIVAALRNEFGGHSVEKVN
jgi:6-phosphogluconate dehydrogenase